MFDDINRLCQLSGASYEKAKKEYTDQGCDFYRALGVLQTQGFDGKGFDRRQDPGYGRSGGTGSTYSYAGSYGGGSFAQRRARMMGRRRQGVENFLGSYLKINDLRVPLILSVICLVFGFEILIPAAIIALICGVKFSFEGPLFDGGSTAAFGTDAFRKQAEAFGAEAFGNRQTTSAPEADKGVAYRMPPRYEYESAYAGRGSSENSGYERDISEEKGFF